MILLFELFTPRTYGTIFTVSCIAFIITALVSASTKKIPMKIPIFIMGFCILSITTCSYDNKKNSVDAADDWTGEKHFENIQDAKDFAVGTWVSSKGRYWVKFIVNSDGTYQEYSAIASNGKWNDDVKSGTWNLVEERDDYGVKEINIYFDSNNWSFQISPNIGRMRIGSPDVSAYEKTDKDPW
jgi:hypothetical protein